MDPDSVKDKHWLIAVTNSSAVRKDNTLEAGFSAIMYTNTRSGLLVCSLSRMYKTNISGYTFWQIQQKSADKIR